MEQMAIPWSNKEVELIVADYFNMLSFQLAGKKYTKAEHRRNLQLLLNNRSEGSIEFKHQNISAVLINLGQPYIKGYLPRYNYQKVLEDVILDFLIQANNFEEQFSLFSQKVVDTSKVNIEFNRFVVKPPKPSGLNEPSISYIRNPIKVNYLEREQQNRKLGEIGEELAINFERWSLINIGKENLADQVEWVSKEQGDGAGFDVLSRNRDGTDKYIEVKSTKLSKETPFYFSHNELRFSQKHSNNYHLYRIFNMEDQVRMFIKIGDLNTICHSTPVSYKGYF